jgi:hypothetical protein
MTREPRERLGKPLAEERLGLPKLGWEALPEKPAGVPEEEAVDAFRRSTTGQPSRPNG